ncbi:Y-family DNA polymerase [Blastopirellula marina]|uniref:Nucleotidyltransferase n=1 Tax=Blastopirellula marina TaxID=124 RepID=A0A2S8FA08_9BACT|nr:DNA polymerase Y family protein [Blastopirellula marina]PQO28950.1 nucleotidyltransferase [Blastopirellula marina]PTL42223.1 DNA polymerase Y family protein [Blastopirellula marina]
MSFLQRPQRILCLWFPDWSVQRLQAIRPELARSVVVLTETTSRGDFVDRGNALAWRRGIRPGMPASEAETLARPSDALVMQSIEPDADRAALLQIALDCEPFSFCIGLEETERPECLWMDVTGIAHFFAGEDALVERLQQTLAKRDYQTRIAIANTIGMAWAVTHCLGPDRATVIVPHDDRDWRTQLPIEGLRISETIRAKLHRLGIQTVGQLRRLDRASLWSRFGEDLLRRIDQLTGERPEMIIPCRPLPKFQVKQSLEYGLTQPERIEQFWRSQLLKLVALLTPTRLGTRHLYCEFMTENCSRYEIHVRLCVAESGANRLAELMRLQLERQRFSAPVTGIQLEARDVAPLECSQQEMFQGTSHEQARQFSQLLDRLSSRLGDEAVARPVRVPTAIPENAVRLVPVTQTKYPTATSHDSLFPLDRPTALFPQPRPIEAIATVPDGPPTVLFWKRSRIDVAHHWGPERIEFGWWLGPFVRRDYYRVASSEGRRLWVFRRLQDGRWFWHGEWF